jgi:hypothetical protein
VGIWWTRRNFGNDDLLPHAHVYVLSSVARYALSILMLALIHRRLLVDLSLALPRPTHTPNFVLFDWEGWSFAFLQQLVLYHQEGTRVPVIAMSHKVEVEADTVLWLSGRLSQ